MKKLKKFIQSFFLVLLYGLIVILSTSCKHFYRKRVSTMDMSYSTESTREVKKSDKEWQEILTAEQYYILREKGTEKPFSGKLLLNHEKGIYTCSACGNPLFTSEGKFDSECGWPSFDREVKAGSIKTSIDTSHGMLRTEIMCGKCEGHLGHIFNDGPTDTGKRYCVNSISLDFIPVKNDTPTTHKVDTITLGGGCFWCIEAVYKNLMGVISVESGFSGGNIANPTYEQAVSGITHHAEVVQIVFDKKLISLQDILKVFFTIHDPTTFNRQGVDIGTQYRSIIFFRNKNQRKTIERTISELQKEKIYSNPIVTLVESFTAFYKAEDYHQNYYQKNKEQPYCQRVIQPKIEKFEKIFRKRLKGKQ